MPPRPGPPNSAKVVFSGTFRGASWANVLWLQDSAESTPTADQVIALATAMSGRYQEELLPHLSAGLVLGLTSVVYFLGEDEAVEGSLTTSADGGREVADLPAQVSICLSWGIAAYYRGGHPRTYLCGICDGDLEDARTISTSAASTFAGAGESFRTTTNALSVDGFGDVSLGTVSFVTGGAARDTPLFRPYQSCNTHLRLDTQRRRLGREA